MATRNKRRGYAQVSGFRRYLRKFPDEVRQPIKGAITETCDQIIKGAQRRVPRKTGTLANALSFKVGRDGLTAQVGILGKRAQRKAYYGAFVEFGTNGYRKGSRRHAKGRKTTKVLRRNVARQPARPFFFPSVDQQRPLHQKRIADALQETLRRMEF